MSIVEFFVFIVIMIVMGALNVKRAREKQVEPDEEEERITAPPLPFEAPADLAADHIPDDFELQMIKERGGMKGLQRKLFHSPGEKQAYEQKKKGRSELSYLIEKDMQEAVLLKEILDKPKGW